MLTWGDRAPGFSPAGRCVRIANRPVWEFVVAGKNSHSPHHASKQYFPCGTLHTSGSDPMEGSQCALAGSGTIASNIWLLCIVKTWLLRSIPDLNSRPPSTTFVYACWSPHVLRPRPCTENLLGIDHHSWWNIEYVTAFRLQRRLRILSGHGSSSRKHSDNNQISISLFYHIC
jgi:hypothetical protein